MDSSQNNVQLEISKVFALMTKALKKVGYVELESVLKSLVVEGEFADKKYHVVINHILDLVVEEWSEYKIKKEDLFQFKKRGEVTVARKMAIILIKEHIEISDNKLATYFGNRCRQVVYGVMKEYEGMNIEDRFDVKFLEKHKKIKIKIIEFLQPLEKAVTKKKK